jgi:hypothetical protein
MYVYTWYARYPVYNIEKNEERERKKKLMYQYLVANVRR